MTRTVFSIAIGRSRTLLAYFIIIHTIALVMLLSLWGLSVSLGTLLSVLILAVSLVYYCQQYQWLASKKAIFRVERDTYNEWTLHHQDNTQTAHLTLKSSVVTQPFIMLNFIGQSMWKSYSITIMSDAVDGESLRQLRVYCRDPKTFLPE